MKNQAAVTVGSLIAKVKNGLDLLSQIGCASSVVGHPVAAAVGLGAGVAGLFLALHARNNAPWIPGSDGSSDVVCYVGGLHNLGNNCFLNVILQALASCSSFLLYLKSTVESENVLFIDKTEGLPLMHALILLLEELRICKNEKITLSPKRVMSALSLYTANFNLTRQQDAAEALLHLLTSLRSEILLCYVPHGSSISRINDFASRVYKKEIGYGIELDQWKRIIFGPFDGTLRSTLTCLSCSSVLSVDYEHFDCLPLSPVLNTIGDTTGASSLINCLKHFCLPELLENYRCDKCWHISALKYMLLKSDTDEGKISKLRGCVNYDNCSCPELFQKDEITWSGFSRASKQLTLNQCPKILCMHVQRALMSLTGEFVKYEMHVPFPFVLDLSPFTKPTSTLNNASPTKPLTPNMHFVPHILKIMEKTTVKDRDFQKFDIGSTSETREDTTHKNQESNNLEDTSSGANNCKYSLCAVIEHYGKCGGGHYAAYRKAPVVHDNGINVEGLKTGNDKWFYVSDSHVLEVPEETVLNANATLLFYERI